MQDHNLRFESKSSQQNSFSSFYGRLSSPSRSDEERQILRGQLRQRRSNMSNSFVEVPINPEEFIKSQYNNTNNFVQGMEEIFESGFCKRQEKLEEELSRQLYHQKSTSSSTIDEQQIKPIASSSLGTSVPPSNQVEEIKKEAQRTQPLPSQLNDLHKMVQLDEQWEISLYAKHSQLTYKSILGFLSLFKIFRVYFTDRFQEELNLQNPGKKVRNICDLNDFEFIEISSIFLASLQPEGNILEFERYDELRAIVCSGQGKKGYDLPQCKLFRESLIKQTSVIKIINNVFSSKLFKFLWSIFATDESFKFEDVKEKKEKKLNKCPQQKRGKNKAVEQGKKPQSLANKEKKSKKTILSISYRKAGEELVNQGFKTPVHWNTFLNDLEALERSKGLLPVLQMID